MSDSDSDSLSTVIDGILDSPVSTKRAPSPPPQGSLSCDIVIEADQDDSLRDPSPPRGRKRSRSPAKKRSRRKWVTDCLCHVIFKQANIFVFLMDGWIKVMSNPEKQAHMVDVEGKIPYQNLILNPITSHKFQLATEKTVYLQRSLHSLSAAR